MKRLFAALAAAAAAVLAFASPALAVPAEQYENGQANTDQNVATLFSFYTKMQQSFYGSNGSSGALKGTYDLVPDMSGFSDGFVLVVHDQDADGKRVGVRWKTKDGTIKGLCVNKQGKDYNLGNGYGAFCTTQVPEGHTILFRIGVCDNDVAPCGDASNYTTKLDNWTWLTATNDPIINNGWRDYKDDDDNNRDTGCSEVGTNNDC